MNFSLLLSYLYPITNRSLYAGVSFLLVLGVCSWYFFIHKSLYQEVSRIYHQNALIKKRLDSLLNRSQRVTIESKYSEKNLADLIDKEKSLPESFDCAAQMVLSHANNSGLTMVSWNMHEVEQKEVYATCCIVCSFIGSYKDYTDFLGSIENFSCVVHCLLKKRVTDMSIRVTLRLFFRKSR